MAKMKKFQRVEIYLRELKKKGEISDADLMKLHFRDMMDLPEMEGIGDRTISNALKAFKKELGVLPRQNAISKRQKVRDYLDEQMQSGAMTSDELMELRFQDLMGREALKGIGKTTISCTLSVYKKNYEKHVFEHNIISFLDKEKGSENKPAAAKPETLVEKAGPSAKSEFIFSNNEISVLKQMLDQYRENQYFVSEKRELELQELKQALSFSGIDCKRILELYWKSRKEVVIPVANLIQNQHRDLFKMENAG